MKKSLLLALGLLIFSSAMAKKEEVVLYKTVDTTKLVMTVIYPEKAAKKNPAAVCFFGGAWHHGNIDRLRYQAKVLTDNGITCFLVDYRVFVKHNTLPDACVEDAKSAMRFVRGNAKKFKIDPDRIIGLGYSAGGHMAAAAAFIEELNAPTDNMKVSAKPNALVLFNPVADTSPAGYQHQLIKKLPSWQAVSATHHIKNDAPPTIYMVGDKDTSSTISSANLYKSKYEAIGSYCDLKVYPDCKHGFFHYKENDTKNFDLTMKHVVSFLQEIKYVK